MVIEQGTSGLKSNPAAAGSSGTVLAYFNRYQQVLAGILEGDGYQFDEQTMTDMRAYGTEEPSIFSSQTFAGLDFYGFMTSPESYALVRQGILENVAADEQARQLEILELVKIDSERMVREYPREMDGPVANAQAVHLAFVQTVNPAGAEEALANVGPNEEIVERIASGVILSMSETELMDNFTAPVLNDPTIVTPEPDSPSTLPVAPTLVAAAAPDVAIPPVEEPVFLETISLEVEEDPAVVEDEAPSHTDYEVQSGDSLWKIAEEFYGLESAADIQQAVAAIAHANGLQNGADANDIDIGQVLKLPDSPVSEGKTLDWAALDRDSGISISSTFAMTATGQTPAPANIDSAPEIVVRPQTRPDGLAPAA